MEISLDIKYVGVNDREIDLFEGQYVVPNGMAYNSYVIMDEKIAVLDSVDCRFSKEWLLKLEEAMGGRQPNYLIVQHMEPDHSGSIMQFVKRYPQTQIVASSKAFTMMKNFFATDFKDKQVVVSGSSNLNLGKHNLSFIEAPMVHWPEVIMTYDECDKVLFSADAFGKFGALDTEEDWTCEARRYYVGIVGKYGALVQNVLKKISNLDIKVICPLHGPALKDDIMSYINLYNTWSSYNAESEGIVIAYTSIYGNTKQAVMKLKEILEYKGEKVIINDLARCDIAEAVEDVFRYGKIILATTTYNGEIFPFMREFIEHIIERNFQNKAVGFIENGSWLPMATKIMKEKLQKCKNLRYTTTNVKILSTLNEESTKELYSLADEIINI